jgi:hypothetical protein
MNLEKHEKGSKSTSLELMDTPQIALMAADYLLVEFEDQFPGTGKLIVRGKSQ